MIRTARASPALSTPGNSQLGVITLVAEFSRFLSHTAPLDDTVEEGDVEDEIPEMDETPMDSDVITNHQASTSPLPSPWGSTGTASTGQTSVNPFRREFGTPTGNPKKNLQLLVQERSQLFRLFFQGIYGPISRTRNSLPKRMYLPGAKELCN